MFRSTRLVFSAGLVFTLLIFLGVSNFSKNNSVSLITAAEQNQPRLEPLKKDLTPKEGQKADPAPADGLDIYGIGKQWLWKFQHNAGQRELNELHVPVGQAFKLILTSEDVIHCLSMPDLKLRVELQPGKYTSVSATPMKTGKFSFHCDQYCGVGHKTMTGTLVVMEKAEFERWLEGRPDAKPVEESLEVQGRQVFLKMQCVVCHNSDPKGKGPNLEELYGKTVSLKNGNKVKVDELYFLESIRHPKAKIREGWNPIMPAYTHDQLSEEDMLKVIVFLKGLKKGGTPIRTSIDPAPVGAPTDPSKKL